MLLPWQRDWLKTRLKNRQSMTACSLLRRPAIAYNDSRNYSKLKIIKCNYKHLKNDHGLETIGDLTKNFSLLKKCNGKLHCLIYEMLFIKEKRPRLNTVRLHTRKTIYLNLSLISKFCHLYLICHFLHAHFLRSIASHGIY